MKREVTLVIAGMLIAFLAMGIVFSVQLSAFHSEGVHVLGSHAYIDLQKKCYFISANTLEPQIVGSSVFTMNGYLKDDHGTEAGTWYGHLGVPEYPIPIEIGYHNYTGGIGEKFISINNLGMSIMEVECDAYYRVDISREDPSVIFVVITEDDGQTIVAVCGESEEEAMDNYQRYWDIMRDGRIE